MVVMIKKRTMTRINVGVLPKELSDKHLLAEHREIKRIPNMVASGKAKIEGIPEKFTLGKGHVKFFYNKLAYLYHRYNRLYLECRKRGFDITYYGDAWDFKNKLIQDNYHDYKERPEDRRIILQRINERLSGVK